jgi:hypothetical protein
MTTDQTPTERKQTHMSVQGGGDAVYGIGMFGAWAFYLGRAVTPEEKVKAFLKGFIWPAMLVYEVLQFLHKDPA